MAPPSYFTLLLNAFNLFISNLAFKAVIADPKVAEQLTMSKLSATRLDERIYIAPPASPAE